MISGFGKYKTLKLNDNMYADKTLLGAILTDKRLAFRKFYLFSQHKLLLINNYEPYSLNDN
jgi:hypothetical protein